MLSDPDFSTINLRFKLCAKLRTKYLYSLGSEGFSREERVVVLF